MIQANELRIGNLVYDKASNIREICGIQYPYTHLTSLRSPVLAQSVQFNEIEPIKLTGQILMNCGFKLRDNTEDGTIYGLLNTTIIYTRSVGSGMCFFLNGYHNDVHLQFLHQLQNLFFLLTGNELEIMLN